MSDGPQTVEEAKQLFRDAAAAARAKLPASVAAKLTAHLDDIAETTDFESTVGAMIGRSWHQCAVDLIAMPAPASPAGPLVRTEWGVQSRTGIDGPNFATDPEAMCRRLFAERPDSVAVVRRFVTAWTPADPPVVSPGEQP